MISPVSSGASAYLQSVPAAKPQAAPVPSPQIPGSSNTEDKVELSSQAKSASSASSYTKPNTVMAHTARGKSAS